MKDKYFSGVCMGDINKDVIFKLLEYVRGEGYATHKALQDLEYNIRERLGGVCRELDIEWGYADGDFGDVVYAEFRLFCNGKGYLLKISLDRVITADVMDVEELK
jgi:hypothetical protein